MISPDAGRVHGPEMIVWWWFSRGENQRRVQRRNVRSALGHLSLSRRRLLRGRRSRTARGSISGAGVSPASFKIPAN